MTTRKRELSRRKNRLVAIQIIRQGMTIHNALAWIARDDSEAIEQLKSVLIIERLNGFRLCNLDVVRLYDMGISPIDPVATLIVQAK